MRGRWHTARLRGFVLAGALVVLAGFTAHAAQPAEQEANAAAGETPVTLSADDFGEIVFGEYGKLLTAHGNVHVAYKDLTVTADELVFDLESNVLHLVGGVTLAQGEFYMEGEALDYVLDEETGTVVGATGEVTGDGIDGIVHLSGDRVESSPGRVIIHGGSVTTCNVDEPHYHLDAREIEVYVGDRIVIRGVSYWESGIPLFYWPMIVLSLNNPDQNRIQLPRIGYDERDGWFVKSTFQYDVGGSGYGYLYTDWFERAGIGLGVRHVYEDEDDAFGAAEVYYRENRLTNGPDVRLGWERIRRPSDILEYAATVEYEERGLYADEVDAVAGADEREAAGRRLAGGAAEVAVQYEEPGRRLAFDVSAERDAETDAAVTEWELGTAAALDVTDRWRLSLDGTLSRSVTEAATADASGNVQWETETSDTLLAYFAAAEWHDGPTTFQLLADQRLHPDLLDDENDGAEPAWRSVQRVPEMVLSHTGWRMPAGGLLALRGLPDTVPLHGTLGLGRFREEDPEGNVQAVRAYAELKVPTQRVPLTESGRVTFTAGGSVRPTLYFVDDYGPNAERQAKNGLPWRERIEPLLVLQSNAGLELRPTDSLTARVAYEYRQGLGETPFEFDRESWRERMAGSTSWHRGGWTLGAWGAYRFDGPTSSNLTAEQPHWEPFAARIAYRPSDRWGGEIQAAYDVYDERVTDVIGRVELSPTDRFSLRLGAKGDPAAGEVERVDAALHFELPAGWGFSYEALWDGADRRFDLGNFAVSKMIQDCRELIFRYDAVDRTGWVEYRITAFPAAVGLGLGADDEALMFDPDTFDKLLKDVGGALNTD